MKKYYLLLLIALISSLPVIASAQYYPFTSNDPDVQQQAWLAGAYAFLNGDYYGSQYGYPYMPYGSYYPPYYSPYYAPYFSSYYTYPYYNSYIGPTLGYNILRAGYATTPTTGYIGSMQRY